MRLTLHVKMLIITAMTLLLASVMSAYAAGLTLSPTGVGRQSLPVTAQGIKPAACDGLFLTRIISGSGMLTGTSSNDLIIGSGGADTIDGLGGDDCIVAGNGDDTLIGGDGSDVCLGGPGNDTLDGACETSIQ